MRMGLMSGGAVKCKSTENQSTAEHVRAVGVLAG